jgi:hypothetical protein
MLFTGNFTTIVIWGLLCVMLELDSLLLFPSQYAELTWPSSLFMDLIVL